MEKRIILAIWIITTFLISNYGWEMQVYWNLVPEQWSGTFRHLVVYSWMLIPPALMVGLLFGWRSIFKEMGLQQDFGKGLGFALLCTLPMLIGYAILAKGAFSISWTQFWFGCVGAGFVEEYLYRGFLFGLLHRRAKWPFIPAAILAAIIFGSAHLYQGSDWSSLMGIFMITGIGSVWFSWLYKQWNFNLWVPIGLHFLMNFYWNLFDVDTSAMGGLWANIFRGATIALSIVFTIRWQIKRAKTPRRKGILVSEM